ncbi:hypothetical protein EXIGLDRAFT_771244 [Exidia glandulosa HHB12029]|uniref:DNA helicase n=1 Tax=Exidia glandulosa HHB12029 TaxID=1314781 RepID=A0A165G491_EXIGL|nr:hypothetical protein EXIGLDRAFT_771244 [Exidia glandulosa HHB12029]
MAPGAGKKKAAASSGLKLRLPARASLEERVASRKAEMVLTRQARLEQIKDEHDDMVRELFHLEKFVTLVEYDPAVAKQDTTTVFSNYKAQYDLVSKTNIAQQSTSRKTRSAANERRESVTALIQTPLKSLASTPVPTPTIARASIGPQSPLVMKTKRKSLAQNDNVATPREDADAERAPVRPLKISFNKGKQKADPPAVVDLTPAEDPFVVPSSKPLKRGRGSRSSIASDAPVQRTTSRSSAAPGVESQPPRRRASHNGTETKRSHQDFQTVALHDPLPDKVPRQRRKRKRTPSPSPSRSSTSSPTPASTPPPPLPADSPLRRVKRIKLVHRIPYSHPAQIPPLPKYGRSLRAFLDSYVDYGDDPDIHTDPAAIREEVHLRRCIDAMRMQGRLLPAWFDTTAGNGMDVLPDPDTGGPWRGVVAQIEAEAKKILPDARAGAAKVAKLVDAHFGRVTLSDEQRRRLDERRAKKLAKDAIRDVTNEWKKAVFHIREKKAAQALEEERRQGRMHLDEILAQSGSMLEAQAEDLLPRSRSRSVSIAESFRDGDDEEEEEEEEVDGEHERQDDDDSSSDAGDEEDDEDDVGTGLLVGEDASQARQGDSDDEADMALIEDHVSLDAEDDMPDEDVSHAEERTTPSRSRSRAASLSVHFADDASRKELSSDTTREGSAVNDGEEADDLPTSLLAKPTLLDEQSPEGRPTAAQYSSRSVSEAPGEPAPAVEAGIEQDVPTADAPNADGDVPESRLQDDDKQKDQEGDELEDDEDVPDHLRDYAVAPVEWDPNSKVMAPLLLRGTLRPYQQSGLEWLASLHTQSLDGILADEMGLGKTIQTIALLAHLACDLGIWGPHLVVVPTSVLLNWEMEFKKFLPGFKILAYHGSTKRRKDLRAGWTSPYAFNVCVTSYALAARDAMLFKRKAWYYLILDEAHMIKNFKSQRWNTLLGFRSRRRLLLTGTPLQNNLTELWSLLQFLMSGSNFANLKEFGEWFANPLEKAIEQGTVLDQETKERVNKLHTVLRPYLLRRLKADVERELPQKYDHLVLCKLSKRQRFLYDEFMSRAQTRAALDSGVYQKIANVLMQLRKVCNHPDLFEVRPIVSPFAMPRSAVADFEIKELLVRKRFFEGYDASEELDLDMLGFRFTAPDVLQRSSLASQSCAALCASDFLYDPAEYPEEQRRKPPPKDTRTIAGFREYEAWRIQTEAAAARRHLAHVNSLKCTVYAPPLLGAELLRAVRISPRVRPLEFMDDPATRRAYWRTGTRAAALVRSFAQRAEECAPLLSQFMCTVPAATARDVSRFAASQLDRDTVHVPTDFDAPLHHAISLRSIAFPDAGLLQYDCGKLQELFLLLRKRQLGGHRVLIFTQMTKVLDILEAFLNLHGWRYLRLDGATKIEDRQYITERFNSDSKVFAFIASSRSGGVGINLTGADTVIFYDSDFNPQMDKQCEDRAHRIGQIRDVHIYRFISAHTVEEAMLRKANQKRALDDLVIQQGGFDWRRVLMDESSGCGAMVDFAAGLEAEEDDEDARARRVALREEAWRVGEDEDDFGAEKGEGKGGVQEKETQKEQATQGEGGEEGEEEEDGGTVTDYMLAMVERDWEWFSTWRV